MENANAPYNLHGRGLWHKSNGDYREAIECFTPVIEENPENITSHIHRGDCYFELGHYREAASDYSVALHNADAADLLQSDMSRKLHYKCACAYLAIGDFAAAARNFYVADRNVR